jgi:hypothetical protein
MGQWPEEVRKTEAKDGKTRPSCRYIMREITAKAGDETADSLRVWSLLSHLV